MNRFDNKTSAHKSNAIRTSAVTLAKAAGIATMGLTLSGCILTSPFWNQAFSSHTDQVPMQAFTTDKSKNVKFECAKAYHGGLHPSEGTATWVQVANVAPTQSSLLDPLKGKIYSAKKLKVLPAACWRYDNANGIWYAGIRATQGSGASTVKYKTFSKNGLECLGREVGKATSWFGWIGDGCTQTYGGSNTEIPYVIFRADS